MFNRLPPIATLLGAAGVLPFLGCAALAVTKGDWQAIGVVGLIGYGAVILAFLGGVQWGFALVPGVVVLQRLRLVLGVVPSLIGWMAVAIGQLVSAELALALLVTGFLGTIAVEARWVLRGVMPAGYMVLRWGLSVVVLITLVTVMVLRLIGATIVF